MRTPTPTEQLLLELANRARADPAGEFDRLVLDRATGLGASPGVTAALAAHGVDLDALDAALDAVAPAPPLAWNPALGGAAMGRASRMVDFDDLSPPPASLAERARAFGYVDWTLMVESLFAAAEDVLHAHAAHLIDWGPGPGGVWSPAGNREAMLSPDLAETGLGAVALPASGRDLGPLVLARHYGRREDAPAALTGVVIDDADGDRFYDPGEGVGDVSVVATGAAGRFETVSWESGGYALALPPGRYEVIFSGGALTGAHRAPVEIGEENEKLDVLASMAAAPGRTILGEPGPTRLLGTAGPDVLRDPRGPDRVEAGAGDDRVVTGHGPDRVRAGEGDDRVETGRGRDVVEAGPGADRVRTGPGSDTIWGERGDDRIEAGPGADLVRAGAGDDVALGGRGRDRLHGGPGDDRLHGGPGDDRLEGGAGLDRLHGGPGRDAFVFAFGFEEDRVLDFDPLSDRLDFSDHPMVRDAGDLSLASVGRDLVLTSPEGGRLVLVDAGGVVPDEIDLLF